VTLIFRYILREYLKIFALAMAAFLVLFQVFDFIERFDYYFRYNPAGSDVLELLLLKTLPAFALSIPVATLLASVLTLAGLNRNSELVAMRAGGVGFLQIAAPLFACGLISSAAVIGLNELALPDVNERLRFVELIKVRKNEQLTFFKRDQVWFKDGPRVYDIDLFLPTEGLLRGVSLYELDATFRPVRRTYAHEGRLQDGRWTFSDVAVVDYGSPATIYAGKTLPFRYGTESLAVLEKRPDEMTFRELRGFIRKLRKEHLKTAAYETDLHARIAFGLVSILLALVGLPFSMKPARHGGAMLAIALAIALGFSYWVALSFSVTLGKNGVLPPALAAWLPNAAFSSLAIFFFRRMG
jgi:lipopolysaccharide export system permease protein